ncbi:hypothetical protein ACE939_05735 [Aquimarina sp. W85]|uniref:hypothetical protein n=1 Tax=Aquimarina rhodophyticola TaxID=3342246 RepID=UPI00366E6BBF
MAKTSRPKNTKNKAKHDKLMDRKKNKVRQKKIERIERLKLLKEKIKVLKENIATNE